jgi:polyisoprenyl-phosphate glycosyltransferase
MLSLVIPVYNEEVLIHELFARVKSAIESLGPDFEVIMVDDGSTDGTLRSLELCHDKDKRFKIVSLSRNFGHQAAYTAGLNYAKGDFIAMLDGDLQDPPELIRDMYHKATEEGFDVVYGRRIKRHESFSKKLFTRIFHFIFSRLSNLENMKQVGNFSLMSKRALNSFLSLHEKNRYLPGLRAFVGFKQGFVDYSRPDRAHGEAKMSIYKLVTLGLDAIFSFSSLPVKICLYSGLIGVVLIFFALIYILVGKLGGYAPVGWSSIILSVYFIGSVQLVSIGILGEYVYRIYKETQNRPIFIVNKFID